MRIATYNVEWFNTLFDDDGELLNDLGWSSRHDVTRQAQLEALGIVFLALNADVIMVVEAPDQSKHRNAIRALENFAQSIGLRARKALIGFANDTQQEIALLYDPDVVTCVHDPQMCPEAPRFDEVFEIDLDVDARADVVRFSKPPLEVRLETSQGSVLRMIGAHLKSKAPHGARSDREAMQISIANRRKQLAQAIWLRRRIDIHLKAGEPLILLGDLNDGPGSDEYENLFGRSSVEIILGVEGAAGMRLYDPHADWMLKERFGAAYATARFYQSDKGRYIQALLDYIMISNDLRRSAPSWRIWHPFDDPKCWQTPELREALLTASDHFPVTLDIAL